MIDTSIPDGSLVIFSAHKGDTRRLGMVLNARRKANDDYPDIGTETMLLVSFLGVKKPYGNRNYDDINACWVERSDLEILCLI